MPPDMRLRSDWDETSFSAPGDRGSIDVWVAGRGEPREEPIPLQKFLRYADWFRETFVPENDPSDVAQLERAAACFRVTTAAGDEADARDVVIAVGVTPFPHAPPPFDAVMGDGVASRSTARTTRPTAAAASSWSAAARAGSRRRRSRAAPAPRSSSSSARSCAGSPTASRTSRAGALQQRALPGRLSRRRLRPAAAEPAGAASGRVRGAPGAGAPRRGAADPARRRLPVGARRDRGQGAGSPRARRSQRARAQRRRPPADAQRRLAARGRRGRGLRRASASGSTGSRSSRRR